MATQLNPRNPGNQPALRLRIEHRSSGDHFYVLTLDYAELEDGEVRSGLDSPLENLQIRVQGHDDEPGKLYGWSVAFHKPWEVTARDAERMLAIHRRIAHSLEKARDRDGHEQGFGQYLIRVCRAVGINSIVFDARKGADIATGKPHSVRNAVDGAHYIEAVLMNDWRLAVEKGTRVAA